MQANRDINTSIYLPYNWRKNNGESGSGGDTKPLSQDLYYSTSVNTPGFRFRKKRTLPKNPYFQKRNVMYAPASSMTMVDTYTDNNDAGSTWNFQLNTHSWGGRPFKWDDVDQVEVEGPCGNDLLRRIDTAKASTPVSVAEAHKTAALVAQSATKIYKSIKALRSLNLIGAAEALGLKVSVRREKNFNRQRSDFLKTGYRDRPSESSLRLYDPKRARYVYKRESDVSTFASQTWLELQYGWKPLLSDIHANAEALAAIQTERQLVTRVVTASKQGKVVKVFRGNDGLGETWERIRTVTIETYCKMSVGYRPKESYPNPMHVFGMNNPATVVWELVPFSFVADWFLPIGNYLQSFTATSGLEFVWGWKTTRTKRTIKSQTFQRGIYVSGNFRRLWSGSATGEYWEMFQVRSSLGGFPSPTFPPFKDPRSFSHAASAIALLQSIFLRK